MSRRAVTRRPRANPDGRVDVEYFDGRRLALSANHAVWLPPPGADTGLSELLVRDLASTAPRVEYFDRSGALHDVAAEPRLRRLKNVPAGTVAYAYVPPDPGACAEAYWPRIRVR